jgi:hypothetical protein
MIWFELNPLRICVRLMLLSGGLGRIEPLSLVAKDVRTGSGGLLRVSLTFSAVPLVIMMLVNCAPMPELGSTFTMK